MMPYPALIQPLGRPWHKLRLPSATTHRVRTADHGNLSHDLIAPYHSDTLPPLRHYYPYVLTDCAILHLGLPPPLYVSVPPAVALMDATGRKLEASFFNTHIRPAIEDEAEHAILTDTERSTLSVLGASPVSQTTSNGVGSVIVAPGTAPHGEERLVDCRAADKGFDNKVRSVLAAARARQKPVPIQELREMQRNRIKRAHSGAIGGSGAAPSKLPPSDDASDTELDGSGSESESGYDIYANSFARWTERLEQRWQKDPRWARLRSAAQVWQAAEEPLNQQLEMNRFRQRVVEAEGQCTPEGLAARRVAWPPALWEPFHIRPTEQAAPSTSTDSSSDRHAVQAVSGRSGSQEQWQGPHELSEEVLRWVAEGGARHPAANDTAVIQRYTYLKFVPSFFPKALLTHLACAFKEMDVLALQDVARAVAHRIAQNEWPPLATASVYVRLVALTGFDKLKREGRVLVHLEEAEGKAAKRQAAKQKAAAKQRS